VIGTDPGRCFGACRSPIVAITSAPGTPTTSWRAQTADHAVGL